MESGLKGLNQRSLCSRLWRATARLNGRIISFSRKPTSYTVMGRVTYALQKFSRRRVGATSAASQHQKQWDRWPNWLTGKKAESWGSYVFCTVLYIILTNNDLCSFNAVHLLPTLRFSRAKELNCEERKLPQINIHSSKGDTKGQALSFGSILIMRASHKYVTLLFIESDPW